MIVDSGQRPLGMEMGGPTRGVTAEPICLARPHSQARTGTFSWQQEIMISIPDRNKAIYLL